MEDQGGQGRPHRHIKKLEEEKEITISFIMF